MHDLDFPLFLWGEASQTTMYIQNRRLDKVLEVMALKEAFSKMKPNVGHMKIFSCHVYIHVPKDKRNKIEPSRKKEYLSDT